MTLYLIDIKGTRTFVEEFDGTIWETECYFATHYCLNIRDVDAFPITSLGVQYDSDIYSDVVETTIYNDE